jgi:hypothetical protein
MGICTVYQLFLSAATTIVDLCFLLLSCIAPRRILVDAREAPCGQEHHGQGKDNELRD